MKKITEKEYEKIAHIFPKARNPAKINNITILNALMYILENGCKWRALPSEYGRWHTVYMRLSRWMKAGVLQEVFVYMQRIGMIRIKVRIVSLDSTSIKVHPDGMGALKKEESKASEDHAEDGTLRFIWLPLLTETP